MDTAVAALKINLMVFVVVTMSLGIFVHQIAKITASTAAVAAASAAAQVLDDRGWDCTDTHPGWPDADVAAAEAAAARTGGRGATVATGFTLAAEPSCTVVATVTVAAAGSRRWLEATAVACRPAQAARTAGWALSPTC